ncbi:MAG TPA: amino acid adenylation domain-containing protein [Thermoanaerobaculia bacterium]|jgi:amino acid adenylation domain-containing protein
MRSPSTPATEPSLTEKRAHLARLLREKLGTIPTSHPLSYGQRELWVQHWMTPHNTAYNEILCWQVRSPIDVPALRRALQALVDRHAALRTTFALERDEPVQRVQTYMEVAFEVVDASAWSPDKLNAALSTEVHRPFDLERGPAIRMQLCTRSAENHTFLIVAHHIAIDDVSSAILSEELRELYKAERLGGRASLPSLAVRYIDFVRWQAGKLQGEEGEGHWAYWRRQLGGAPPALHLPTDRPRPPAQTFRGALRSFEVSEPLRQQLLDLARSEGVTFFMVTLAAYQTLLCRYTGQEDFVVGSPLGGRRPEFERVVGNFVNLLALRADLSGNPTVRQLLARTQEVVAGAIEHRDYPLSLLIDRLEVPREPSRQPFFQTAFAWEALYRAGGPIDGEFVPEHFVRRQGMARYDLMCMMAPLGTTFCFFLEYNTDLYDSTTLDRLGRHFLLLMAGLASSPGQRLADIEMLTVAERHQLLVEPSPVRLVAGEAPTALAGSELRAVLVDSNLVPVPLGIPGELRYVTGLGDGESVGTGELARLLPDGRLEWLGRLDEQVEIRGFRVELGRVEAALCEHPAVREAAVAGCRAVTGERRPGSVRLVAYLVPAQQPALPSDDELRAFLAATLPEFMLPAAFVALEELPRTAGGRVDRRALEPPEVVRGEEPAFVAPRDPMEERLASYWCQVLGAEAVGVHDNFFELGGDSLQAIRLATRLRGALGVDLPLESLFANPTVAGQAAALEQRRPAADAVEGVELPVLTPAPEERFLPFPLTDIQQAYWVGRSGDFELGSVSTHIYLEVDGEGLDMDRLTSAWRRLIERHDMLRAVVEVEGRQRILPTVPPYDIEVVDFAGKSSKALAAELDAIRERMSHQVLPSDRWPLFDLRVSRFDGGRHRLHLSFDLLIGDAWSLYVLGRDLAELYTHPTAELPALGPSFRDYVLAELSLRGSERYRRSLRYWRDRLDDLPPAPELPLARDPSMVRNPRFHRRQGSLDAELWARLKERSGRAGLAATTVPLAAYAAVLAWWSKIPRFTLNLTLFNRLPLHPQVEELIGDFTSLTLLDVDASASSSFADRARRLQTQLWRDLDHREVSGVQVLRELTRASGSERAVTMPVVFTSALNLADADWELLPRAFQGKVSFAITQTPQVWLDMQVMEESGGLRLVLDAVDELFPAGLLDAMFGSFRELLERLAEPPVDGEDLWERRMASRLPAIQIARRSEANATEGPLPGAMLHELFLHQVSVRPDQAAVIAAGRVLTYRELEKRSRWLGHRLRTLGARPNTLVGVVMESGWQQIVAVLGVLTSGAAYLPVDPGLPRERRRLLLERGEVELVVTQPWLERELEWPPGIESIAVENEEPTGEPPSLPPIQGLEDLAYVIFTSGSTGLPKGVMIDHRGAVNTILDVNERFGVGPGDRVFAISSLSFDLSVWDVFGLLAAGGALVIPEPQAARDPAPWTRSITDNRVTVWNSVPALVNLLVEYIVEIRAQAPRSLRLVLMSGDWIPVNLPDRIRATFGEIEVISLGGATEASIWSILYPLGRVNPGWLSIPYGKPMVNQRFHVLNEALEPCPDWVPGHLFIAGIGLAKGYWRDEEKTAASFVAHAQTGERLYRTGDLGRYLPDGNIEFLGREDHQVKIQGYRVELGEVEAALGQHPGLLAAAVVALGEQRGQKRLVGYLVAEGSPAPSPADVREFLGQKLPRYMVPALFVYLDALPLTPNGKVDRKALPTPRPANLPEAEVPAVDTHIAGRLAAIVAEVLGVGGIDISANLFELGATSVDLIRMANRLNRDLGFRPRVAEFYQDPTIAAVVRSYDNELRHSGADPRTAPQESRQPSFELITDLGERHAFRRRLAGLRHGDEGRPSIALGAIGDDGLRRRYLRRQSYREFLHDPVGGIQLGKLLAHLRPIAVAGNYKLLYPSAGSLYPVQIYLHCKPGRVEGLPAGISYCHPYDHRLVVLAPGAELDRHLHHPANRPTFDRAAFSLFLIGRLSAVAPIYGELAKDFCLLEAGAIIQLLQDAAPSADLGLCPVGALSFESIRPLFDLEDGDLLLHSLLGGSIDRSQTASWTPLEEETSLPSPIVEREVIEI